MRSSISDILVVASALAVSAASSIALYVDANTLRERSGQRIGTVSYTRKSTERRSADDVVWGAVTRESVLYDKDTIRTDDDSSAVLTLTDGTKLTLDEQTMITVERPAKGGVRVGLDRGALRAARTEASGQMRVTAAGGAVSMQSGDAVIRAASSNLTASVSSGSAVITTGKGDVAVAARESAVVESGTVKKSEPAVLLTPAFDELFVTTGDDVPVTFRWSDAGSATLAVARDSGFSDAVITRKNVSNETAASFSVGRYFWRVVTAAGSSEIRRLTVEKIAPPALVAPAAGAVVRQNGSPLVAFSWNMPAALSSTLEIASDREFRGSRTALTALSELQQSLPYGTYYWRVRSVIDTGYRKTEVVSAVRSFTVTNTEIVRTALVFPPDGVVVENSASNVFSASAVDGARSYTLTIEEEQNGKTVYQRSSAVNVQSAPTLAPGGYRWRMSAQDAGGKEIASESRRMIVKGSAPKAALPTNAAVSAASNAVSNEVTNAAVNTATNVRVVAAKPDAVKPVRTVKPDVKKDPPAAAPATAVNMSVVPAGAKVVITAAGKKRVLSPGVTVIAPGTYAVSAALEGYVPLTRTVTVMKGETNALSLELRKRVIVTERITLLDDTVVSGKIVKQTPTEVHIDTDDGRKVIKRDEIQGVQYLKK